MNIKMNNKFVLSIAFPQYTKDKSGVSKVIMAHQKMFNEKNVSYIYLFAVKKLIIIDTKTLFSYFGMYIDGQYFGVYTAYDILRLLKKYFDNGHCLLGIHIHHLLYMKLSNIDIILKGIQKAPITVFVHDYYLCCTNYNLMKNNNSFCGGKGLSENYCKECSSYENSRLIEKEIDIFLKKYQERIKFIAPSTVTKKIFLKFHPEFENRIIVLPHQTKVGVYEGNLDEIKDNEKIKIGYMAMPREHKGWEVWKKLQKIYRDKYEFIVFNSSDDIYDGMDKVKVQFTEDNLNAMTDAVRNKKVHAVLMWSMCPETYSYTCFEAYASNAFIITNNISGNIFNVVESENNGKIFSSENELIEFFKNPITVRKEINEFRRNGKRGPMELYENKEIVDLTLNSIEIKDVKVGKRKISNRILLLFLNLLYR